jgi:hypothetical protein
MQSIRHTVGIDLLQIASAQSIASAWRMGGSHVMCLPRLGQHVYVMIACGGCMARCMNRCMSMSTIHSKTRTTLWRTLRPHWLLCQWDDWETCSCHFSSVVDGLWLTSTCPCMLSKCGKLKMKDQNLNFQAFHMCSFWLIPVWCVPSGW